MDLELAPKPAVLRATIRIVRAATGLLETYELTGTPVEEKECEDGSDPPDSSAR